MRTEENGEPNADVDDHIESASDPPLDSISDDALETVRERMWACGFEEHVVRERYMFLDRAGSSFPAQTLSGVSPSAVTALDVLVHLFLGQERLPAETVHRSLGGPLFNALHRTDLIRVCSTGWCDASARLQPIQRLLICSDLVNSDSFRVDHVYDPWHQSARAFHDILPSTRCETFLEVCCGAGHACLGAAQTCADLAYGVDLSPRSVHFARFNQRLNAIRNAQIDCGDLFEPLGSMAFDRIVAHPPYVPVLVDRVMFRDGGIDGERVTMELLRQIPLHLARGGEFYAYMMLSDRRSKRAEQRVRELLGPASQEFDVVLLVHMSRSLVAYVAERAGALCHSAGAQHLLESCRMRGIESFLFGSLLIRWKLHPSALTLRQSALSAQTVEAVASWAAAQPGVQCFDIH